MFYLLRSSAIVCDHDRRIADDRRSMFPYDRRRSQTLLRSAIRDHMETSLKSLGLHVPGNIPLTLTEFYIVSTARTNRNVPFGI